MGLLPTAHMHVLLLNIRAYSLSPTLVLLALASNISFSNPKVTVPAVTVPAVTVPMCVDVGGATAGELARHDAAELAGGTELALTAGGEGAHLLLVEMAERKGSRRKDM